MGVNLFSPNWWISTLVSSFVTLLFIVMIKKFFANVDVPVVSDLVAEA